MKKIIAIVAVIVLLAMTFSGCVGDADVNVVMVKDIEEVDEAPEEPIGAEDSESDIPTEVTGDGQ